MTTTLMDQVGNTLNQVSFILSHEGHEISAQDVYAMAADVQDALAAMLILAHQIEKTEQARCDLQVAEFDRNHRMQEVSCEL